MNAITAWFKGTDGKMRRGHRVHINDDGKPLCRCRTRQAFALASTDGWEISRDEPTCLVCIRIEKRRSLTG